MRKLRILALTVVIVMIAASCKSEEGGGGDGDQAENTGTVNVLNAMEPHEGTAVQAAVDENIGDVDYTVEIEASPDFEEQFPIRTEAGTLDVALVPQPGTVATQAEAGTIVSLEDLGFDIGELEDTVGEYLMSLVEFNGEHWGLPTNVNLKSMIWYPKDDFEAAGYTVPTT